VLAQVLPAQGIILEVASDTGHHAVAFARRFPSLLWQPTEQNPELLRSIEAWRTEEPLANVLFITRVGPAPGVARLHENQGRQKKEVAQRTHQERREQEYAYPHSLAAPGDIGQVPFHTRGRRR
jgi:Protein of unknown function (DUF938)